MNKLMYVPAVLFLIYGGLGHALAYVAGVATYQAVGRSFEKAKEER